EVIRQSSVVEEELLVREVDTHRLGKDDFDVLLLPQNAADGEGDVARVEACRRDLIEERLEGVVILPIDERDPERGLAERVRCVESAESTADDHDTRKWGSDAAALVGARARLRFRCGPTGLRKRFRVTQLAHGLA